MSDDPRVEAAKQAILTHPNFVQQDDPPGERVAELLAEHALAAADAAAWRPMSEAPPIGSDTKLDVWMEGPLTPDGYRVTDCWWNEQYEGFAWTDDEGKTAPIIGRRKGDAVTHWRLAPQPPKEGS